MLNFNSRRHSRDIARKKTDFSSWLWYPTFYFLSFLLHCLYCMREKHPLMLCPKCAPQGCNLKFSATIDWWPTHSGPLILSSIQSRPSAVQPRMAARVLNKLVCWSEPICTLNYCFLLANLCCFLHISTPQSCAGLHPPLRSQAFTLVILGHGSLPNTFGLHTIKGISCLPNDCGQMQAWGSPAGPAPSSVLQPPTFSSEVWSPALGWSSLPNMFLPWLCNFSFGVFLEFSLSFMYVP